MVREVRARILRAEVEFTTLGSIKAVEIGYGPVDEAKGVKRVRKTQKNQSHGGTG
jgi:hypothetical protein